MVEKGKGVKAIIGLGAAGVMILAPLIFENGTAKKTDEEMTISRSTGGSIPYDLPRNGTQQNKGTTVNVEAPERTGTQFFTQAATSSPNTKENKESTSSGSGSFTLSTRQKKSLETANVDTESFEKTARETQSTPDPFIRNKEGTPIGSRDISNKGNSPTMTKKPTQNMTPLPNTNKKSERQTQNMTPLPEGGFF